jgi:hypothetical protein
LSRCCGATESPSTSVICCESVAPVRGLERLSCVSSNPLACASGTADRHPFGVRAWRQISFDSLAIVVAHEWDSPIDTPESVCHSGTMEHLLNLSCRAAANWPPRVRTFRRGR